MSQDHRCRQTPKDVRTAQTRRLDSKRKAWNLQCTAEDEAKTRNSRSLAPWAPLRQRRDFSRCGVASQLAHPGGLRSRLGTRVRIAPRDRPLDRSSKGNALRGWGVRGDEAAAEERVEGREAERRHSWGGCWPTRSYNRRSPMARGKNTVHVRCDVLPSKGSKKDKQNCKYTTTGKQAELTNQNHPCPGKDNSNLRRKGDAR